MPTQTNTVSKRIPPEVVDYLQLHHVITLSTSSFTGMPHADTVVYCNDGQRIFFFAVEGTQMLRNIKDSGYVSFTIDDYTVDWRKVRELQGVGRCRVAVEAEDAAAWSYFLEKFGHGSMRPMGLLHSIVPHEMHFVDFDYATVAGHAVADMRSRVYQIEDAPPPPSQGPVATSLDRFVYEPGEIIFRPGDPEEHFYVVVDGEVEIRGEGYGADQTVVRLGPGQFFGDQGTLRGQRGALTCHAVTRTILLAVDRTSIRDLLRPVVDAD
jgi:uncharacterized protein YhbP (UPF0306 family)